MNALGWADRLLQMHVTESAGENRGPIVDAIETYADLPLGSPWCAAFVWYCFHRSMLDARSGETQGLKPFPGSGSSQRIRAHFEAHDLCSHDPQDLLGWKGALAGWTDEHPSHGHIFFVSERLTDEAGRVEAIRTVEGNAGPGRGAVVALRRTTPETEEGHRLWFLNVSGIVGGQWW